MDNIYASIGSEGPHSIIKTDVWEAEPVISKYV